MSAVNVSIVTYHTDESELRKCLDTLSSAHIAGDIYLIDNSSDEDIRTIAEDYPNVVYHASPNIGYGSAHNIALRKTLAGSTPFHIVMNSDLEFNPSDLEALVKFMSQNPDVGALQPDIINPDGKPQFTVRLLPSPFDLILRRFLPKWIMPGRRRRYELRDADRSRPFNVPYHQGSFMLLRCDTLREVGLFDERFFMYPEDIDLTRRIHAVSKTIFYPYVKVVHNHRRASYHSLRMTLIHIANMTRYFNKWGWFLDPARRQVNRLTLRESCPSHSDESN